MQLEQEVIDDLLGIEFLAHHKKLEIKAEYITNLTVASKSMNGLKWENLCLEKSGDVTSYLSINHKALYNTYWNELAIAIKTNIIPLINQKLDALIAEGRLIEKMKSQILFDMMNIALFQSYSKVCESDFYEELYEIYESGYIPCGWNGKYPEGNIKVYIELNNVR